MTHDAQVKIDAMREGGGRLARVLHSVIRAVVPGVTTADLDRLAEQEILAAGGTPSFKGYRGYPASLCTSVNEGVVHGIPSDTVTLRAGDIIGLDIGMFYHGFCTDMATTVPVGSVSAATERLIATARAALRSGIKVIRAGVRTGDIGAAIQAVIEPTGFGIVRDFVGHGVGVSVHEDPQVPNYGRAGAGAILRDGETIALEPMITIGPSGSVRILDDGWTVVTTDGTPAAHIEQTVAVTERGVEILTPFPWEQSSR